MILDGVGLGGKMGIVGQTKIKEDAIVYILGMGLFDLIICSCTWS